MEESVISSVIASFGPAGSFIAYLIWQQMRRDKIDSERIEADKLLASALSSLKTTIDGWKD